MLSSTFGAYLLPATMIVLFTDFGLDGPYVGQMKAVLYRDAPGVPVVDLFANAPACNPRAAAYLLASYSAEFPPNCVFVAVVDPGVGGQRRGAIVRADSRWFVGPDNGLFNIVAMYGKDVNWWDITWRPARISATFHGRDLFAPVAAALARGDAPPGEPRPLPQRIQPDWPRDLMEIIYIDHFGNAITGLRGEALGQVETLSVNNRELQRARTFSDVPAGRGFWYVNSNGLIEIAVNKGRADEILGVRIGDSVHV